MLAKTSRLSLEGDKSHSARDDATRNRNNLGHGLGERILCDLDADNRQRLLDNRIPDGLRQRLLGNLPLDRGARNLLGEHRQRVGRPAYSHHDTEKERQSSDGLVVRVIEISQKVLPAVNVGELLHHPESVNVVLGDIGRDGGEHRETSREPRDEGHCSRLLRLEADGGLSEPVKLLQAHPRLNRSSAQSRVDGVVVQPEFAELLAEEIFAFDPHPTNPDDLLEELNGVPPSLLILLIHDPLESLRDRHLGVSLDGHYVLRTINTINMHRRTGSIQTFFINRTGS